MYLTVCLNIDRPLYSFPTGSEATAVQEERAKGDSRVFLCLCTSPGLSDGVMYSSPAALPLIASPPTLSILLWRLLHPEQLNCNRASKEVTSLVQR